MQKRSGFVTIISVLVLMLIVLTLITSNSLIVSQTAITSSAYRDGYLADVMTRSCFEEALVQMRSNSWYEEGLLVLDDISCQIFITGNGDERDMEIIVTSGDYVRTTNATLYYIEDGNGGVSVVVDSLVFN